MASNQALSSSAPSSPIAAKKTFGIIGMGRMGARLINAARNAGLELVVALDQNPAPFAIEQDPSLAEFAVTEASAFWSKQPDVTLISTLGPSHVPLLEEGIANGCRRFVIEKPFATSVAEARHAIDAANAAGARVIVNHPRRYCPNFARLAELNGSPEIGKLRNIVIGLGGGSLGCLGVHLFDLSNQLFGATPKSVVATLTTPTSNNVRGDDFFDPGGSVLMTYPDGGRAFLDIADDIGIFPGMRFVFERAVLDVPNEFQPWIFRARREADREAPLTQYGLPLEPLAMDGWQEFTMDQRWSAVIADAAADTPPLCPPELGLTSMEVFAAARWSAETESIVRFPLVQEACDVVYPIP